MYESPIEVNSGLGEKTKEQVVSISCSVGIR